MAKDYTATITLRVPITARSDEQAEERAQQIADAVKYDSVVKKPWFGDDIEITAEVEES